jgi:uncharacterized protein with von Willebrand factor type A (vWA) domain
LVGGVEVTSLSAGRASRAESRRALAAEPPTMTSAVPNWSAGDTIPLRAGRTLRAVDVRDDDADEPPVLVVEDMAG